MLVELIVVLRPRAGARDVDDRESVVKVTMMFELCEYRARVATCRTLLLLLRLLLSHRQVLLRQVTPPIADVRTAVSAGGEARKER